MFKGLFSMFTSKKEEDIMITPPTMEHNISKSMRTTFLAAHPNVLRPDISTRASIRLCLLSMHDSRTVADVFAERESWKGMTKKQIFDLVWKTS